MFANLAIPPNITRGEFLHNGAVVEPNPRLRSPALPRNPWRRATWCFVGVLRYHVCWPFFTRLSADNNWLMRCNMHVSTKRDLQWLQNDKMKPLCFVGDLWCLSNWPKEDLDMQFFYVFALCQQKKTSTTTGISFEYWILMSFQMCSDVFFLIAHF